MKHFNAFCTFTQKNSHGYVPDLLDMESDAIRDQATVAYLRDLGNHYAADDFYLFGDVLKGGYYRSLEIVMQDSIDKFNQAIDDERAKNLELIDDAAWIGIIDPDYKWQHFNQAMYDAGHRESDFA